MPRQALPAMQPRENLRSYPKRRISGYAILEKVAAAAIETPVTKANTALDRTVATPSLPGTHLVSRCDQREHVARRRRHLARNSPISMNSGDYRKHIIAQGFIGSARRKGLHHVDIAIDQVYADHAGDAERDGNMQGRKIPVPAAQLPR